MPEIEQELTITEPTDNPSINVSSEKINVVAYCRVSTDKSDQKNSLDSQKKYFDSLFKSHKNWNNIGIYSDEGISGTSLKKRDNFNKMIYAAQSNSHPIDLIVTKSVSRFSRNIQDGFNIVEQLREKAVYVWFITDDILTEKDDYRTKFSEKMVRAEQESLETSRRVKFGQAVQMQAGVVFGVKDMYGYRIEKDESNRQHFVIIEDEAETVRTIFKLYNEGLGTHRIAKRLEQIGVKSKYKNGWSNTVILRILKQEKYVGDLRLGKTYTPDPLKHTKKYNTGQSNMYYIKNHHTEQAIISRELWNSVQRKLQENALTDEARSKLNNKYWVSGKLYCGICGGKYVRVSKKQVKGTYLAWDCFKHVNRGSHRLIIADTGEVVEVGCNSKQVNQKVIYQAIADIVNEMIKPNVDSIISKVCEYIKSSAEINNNQTADIDISALEHKLEENEIQMKNARRYLLSGVFSEDEYSETVAEYKHDIATIKKQIEESKFENAQKQSVTIDIERYTERIRELLDFSQIDSGDTEQYEDLFQRITQKVIIHPLKTLEIQLTVLPYPIFMRYKATGRGEKYSVEFTVLCGLPDEVVALEEEYRKPPLPQAE